MSMNSIGRNFWSLFTRPANYKSEKEVVVRKKQIVAKKSGQEFAFSWKIALCIQAADVGDLFLNSENCEDKRIKRAYEAELKIDSFSIASRETLNDTWTIIATDLGGHLHTNHTYIRNHRMFTQP